MKNIGLIITFVCVLLVSGCGSGYDSYVNNNIRPLKLNGIVIKKYEEQTGCFGGIIVSGCSW